MPERREPQQRQHRISRITSKIVTIICEQHIVMRYGGFVHIQMNTTRTITITLIIVSMTPAIAEIMALMPLPMAETMEP